MHHGNVHRRTAPTAGLRALEGKEETTLPPGLPAAPVAGNQGVASRDELTGPQVVDGQPPLSSAQQARALEAVLPWAGALQDGALQASIPLVPGEYQVAGRRLVVGEGARVELQLEIKDGQALPARRAGGSFVEFHGPVKIALGKQDKLGKNLLVKVPDLEVREKGEGLQLKAQLLQFLRLPVGPKFSSARVEDVLAQLLSSQREPGPPSPATPQLLDLSRSQLSGQLSLKPGASVALSGAQFTLAPGATTSLTLSGSQGALSLAGQVSMEKLSLEGSASAQLGETSGQFRFSTAIAPEGQSPDYQLELTEVKSDIRSLQAQAGEIRLGLAATTLDEGRLAWSTSRGGEPKVEASGKVRGRLQDTRLPLKLGPHTRALQLQDGEFQGRLSVDQHLKVSATGSGLVARMDEMPLSETELSATLSTQAVVELSRLEVDTEHDQVELEAECREVAGAIRDFSVRTKKGDLTLDASLLQVHLEPGKTVALTLRGPRVDIQGPLQVSTGVESFRILGQGEQPLDVQLTGGAVSGTVHRLAVGGEPLQLEAELEVARGELPSLDFSSPAVSAEGRGQVGEVPLKVGLRLAEGGGDIRLSGQVTGTFHDIELGGKAHPLRADAQTVVNIDEATILLRPSAPAAVAVDLGRTTSSGTLSTGAIVVGSGPSALRLRVAPSSRYQLELDDVQAAPGTAPIAQGRFRLTSQLSATFQAADFIPGVRFQRGQLSGQLDVRGDRARVTDEQLRCDELRYQLEVKNGTGLPAARPTRPKAADEFAARMHSIEALTRGQIQPPNQPFELGQLVGQVDSGVLSLKLPFSGEATTKLGTKARIAEGTEFSVKLSVKGGRIVSGEIEGANVDVDWWLDLKKAKVVVEGDRVKLVGKTKAGLINYPLGSFPSKMSELAAQLFNPAPKPSGKGGFITDTQFKVDVERASISMENMRFASRSEGTTQATAATLQLPGCELELNPRTTLSFRGTPSQGELWGQVQLDALTVANPQLALQGGSPSMSTQVKVEYLRQGQELQVETTLSDFSAQLSRLAYTDGQSNALSLLHPTVKNAQLSFSTVHRLDNPSAFLVRQARLRARGVSAEVEGAQVDLSTYAGRKEANGFFAGRAEQFELDVDHRLLGESTFAVRGNLAEADVAIGRTLLPTRVRGESNLLKDFVVHGKVEGFSLSSASGVGGTFEVTQAGFELEHSSPKLGKLNTELWLTGRFRLDEDGILVEGAQLGARGNLKPPAMSLKP